MQLLKNKILISSVIYIASLTVVAFVFGSWHNFRLNEDSKNSSFFIVLLIFTIFFFSWFYFTIFNVYRKKDNKKITTEAEVTSDLKILETPIAEKTTANFDKESFVSGIIPTKKMPLSEYCETILQNLADKLEVVQGLFYIRAKDSDTFEPVARYAYYSDQVPPVFKSGETLPGQAVKDKRVLIIQNMPESYIPVVSGLGRSKPKSLMMIPIITNSEPVGLIEIAVFKQVDVYLEPALKEIGGIIGDNIIKLMK